MNFVRMPNGDLIAQGDVTVADCPADYVQDADDPRRFHPVDDAARKAAKAEYKKAKHRRNGNGCCRGL